jgi:hypothetical protein
MVQQLDDHDSVRVGTFSDDHSLFCVDMQSLQNYKTVEYLVCLGEKMIPNDLL